MPCAPSAKRGMKSAQGCGEGEACRAQASEWGMEETDVSRVFFPKTPSAVCAASLGMAAATTHRSRLGEEREQRRTEGETDSVGRSLCSTGAHPSATRSIVSCHLSIAARRVTRCSAGASADDVVDERLVAVLGTMWEASGAWEREGEERASEPSKASQVQVLGREAAVKNGCGRAAESAGRLGPGIREAGENVASNRHRASWQPFFAHVDPGLLPPPTRVLSQARSDMRCVALAALEGA